MPYEGWDRNLYVDEALRYFSIPKDKEGRTITMIGAGVGLKEGLLDWCGIAYYYKNDAEKGNGKNSNGYWRVLGKQCLQLIVNEYFKLRAERVYICNQIAFYVMQAAATNGLVMQERKIKHLLKSIKPVTHRRYRNNNGIYKAKQDVGKKVRRKLDVKISPEHIKRILEGKLYDIRHERLI